MIRCNCDRCGKEMTPALIHGSLGPAHQGIIPPITVFKNPESIIVDLCDECCQEVYDFIFKRNEEQINV